MSTARRVFARKCSLKHKPLCPYITDDRGYRSVAVTRQHNSEAQVHLRRPTASMMLRQMFL